MFLTAVGESFNDTEETLLRNEAGLTLDALDHNEKNPPFRERIVEMWEWVSLYCSQ